MKTILRNILALTLGLGFTACALTPYYYDDYGEEYVVEEELYWDMTPYYDHSGYPMVETLYRVDFERLTWDFPDTDNNIDLSLDPPSGEMLTSDRDRSSACSHDGNDFGTHTFGREEIHCYNPAPGRYGILVKNNGLENSRVTLRVEIRDLYDHGILHDYVSEIILAPGEKIALPVVL